MQKIMHDELENWQNIYSTRSMQEAAMMKQNLESGEIHCVVVEVSLNQLPNVFCDTEYRIYVQNEDAEDVLAYISSLSSNVNSEDDEQDG